MYTVQYQSYVWNIMATSRIQLYGSKVVVGDLLLLNGGNKPEIATDALLDEPFENVVLPMVGYDVLYPTNKIGECYQSFLAGENVKFEKNAPDESTAKGSYRRLVARADNLSYEMLANNSASGTTDVRFIFDLPKGSYATMFFRELMLKTVARDSTKAASSIEPSVDEST
jgi:tRNA pseudouridine13 synthase